MNNNPKISIIVPAYEAEKYICRCLDGIIVQSFTDWECIVIDDGSRDRTGEICDNYSKLDQRIIVIHQTNHGVSNARQVGIHNAIGDYIIHVDPDDWIEPNMLESMYEEAKLSNADMVITDYYLDREMFSTYKIGAKENINASNFLKEIVMGNFIGACWNKLVKCSFYKKSFFPEGVNYSEDLFVLAQILQNNPSISYVPKAFYHYMQYGNTNSLINTNKKRLLENKINFISKLEEVCDIKTYSEGYKFRYADIAVMATKLNEISGPEYRLIIDMINEKFGIRKILSIKWQILILLKYHFDNSIFARLIQYR